MKEIKLTMIERKELERISRAQAVSVAQSRRARLILLLAQGAKWVSIREKLGCDTRFISRWRGPVYRRAIGRSVQPPCGTGKLQGRRATGGKDSCLDD